MQKLFLPLSIVIAGGLIAGTIFYTSSTRTPSTANNVPTNTVAEEIRGVQPDDHILGNPNAEIVIVEFSDPECPFCKQFHSTMHQVIDTYGASGKVAWVYRHFPIPQLHPKAQKQGEALECATAQGGNDMFWQFTDEVYKRTASNNSLDIGVYNDPETVPTDATGKPYYEQKTPRSATDAGVLSDIAAELKLDTVAFESCLAAGTYAERVTKDTTEVAKAGGRGTPHSIILMDGEQVPVEGAQSFEVMKGLIDSILNS